MSAWLPRRLTPDEWERINQRERLLYKVSDDYERRMAKPWGRFLLWLLRKTT